MCGPGPQEGGKDGHKKGGGHPHEGRHKRCVHTVKV